VSHDAVEYKCFEQHASNMPEHIQQNKYADKLTNGCN
jgi:hypothetical protein